MSATLTMTFIKYGAFQGPLPPGDPSKTGSTSFESFEWVRGFDSTWIHKGGFRNQPRIKRKKKKKEKKKKGGGGIIVKYKHVEPSCSCS